MEPEVSLPHSHELATCPYPEPDQSNPCPFHFLKNHFNIIIPTILVSCKWSFSIMSPHQNCAYTPPLPHTCHVPPHLILLGLITRIVLSEEYRSLSSSLGKIMVLYFLIFAYWIAHYKTKYSELNGSKEFNILSISSLILF